MRNPYRWQADRPDRPVPRAEFRDELIAPLRDGRAVKLVGGRGMGKSVVLQQVRAHFECEPDARVVLVPGPPEEATLPAFVADIAHRLNVAPLPRASMDLLMEALDSVGVNRLVVLLDEIDQYVLLDGRGELARAWLNRLETLRKSWTDRFAIVVAGGLGLLHVSHVLGSGLLSRAESVLARPFDLEELRTLALPLAERGLSIGDDTLHALAALSGGNPALATYGLGRLWDAGDSGVRTLETVFAEFPERHADFVRAVHDGVSHRGLVGAPGRVLRVLQRRAGALAQAELRAACAGDDPPVDVTQALQLLLAAGLVHVHGLTISDPVQVHPVSSILNMSTIADAAGDPVQRLVVDVAATLGQLHRFGRDFHGDKDILHEQVFSSLLAVGLSLLGWRDVDRESVQAAGFLDLRVRVRHPGLDGHVVLETKIWPRSGYADIQRQVDDYRVSETLHGIAVMIGVRGVEGWAAEYEQTCLAGLQFTLLSTPPDVVAHWRVEQPASNGSVRRTDHFLVQVPKRSK